MQGRLAVAGTKMFVVVLVVKHLIITVGLSLFNTAFSLPVNECSFLKKG